MVSHIIILDYFQISAISVIVNSFPTSFKLLKEVVSF
jgi:hypothetical protein